VHTIEPRAKAAYPASGGCLILATCSPAAAKARLPSAGPQFVVDRLRSPEPVGQRGQAAALARVLTGQLPRGLAGLLARAVSSLRRRCPHPCHVRGRTGGKLRSPAGIQAHLDRGSLRYHNRCRRTRETTACPRRFGQGSATGWRNSPTVAGIP